MKEKWVTPMAFIIVCVGALTGCTMQANETVIKEKANEIVIPVVFRVEPSTNVSDNQNFVDDFNREYAGIYRMDVEWLTESSAGYRNKLKQWNSLDEMPAIITDAGFDYDFYQLLVENHRLVDLKPYMEKSEFWMDSMNPGILTDCTEDDGSVYLSPLGSSVYTYAGIIYNEKYLRQAGYESFPETWDEFFECMEAIKAMGGTPLALHGSGSYWVPMLFATAYMEGTEEGKAFLAEDFPESYQNESMEDMLEFFKKLYEYTFDDVLQLDYEQASNRFLDGNAAMIANGQWMFDVMDEEIKQQMRFASFPGGILMNSPRMGAWAVSEGYDEEITEGAVKALEFRIKCEQESISALLNGEAETLLEKSYAEAIINVSTVMPNYQIKWEQEIQNEFFTEHMPEFLEDKIDIKDFLEMMDIQLKNIKARK